MTSRGNRYPAGADDNADFEPDTQTLSCVPSTLNATAPSDLIRRLTGISELDYEAAKAAKRNGQSQHAITVDDLQTIDQHAQDAAGRGADYISVRRLSELIGATTRNAYADLGSLIATERSARYAPSIYRTTVEAGSN